MTTVKTETQTKPQPRIYGKIVLSLQNCILTDLDEKPTPSEQDGLDMETETDLRILGCELIQTAGILLRLPQVAMATGQVLFQRFFYSKSFVRHSMEAVAMSCVCLASKIEEAPRRIRDVINVFHHIKQVRAQKPLTPIILDQNYINLKSQVIKAERRVLKELGFCVHVKHPHKLVFMYLKFLDFEQHQQMMQMAWNFMNDSFRTDVFVRYQPEKIACACIYLTARKLGIPLPNNPPWYFLFKTTEEEIVDICYRILALYKRSKPNIERLDSAVDKLKQAYQEQRKKEKGGNNTPPLVTTVADRNNGAHNAWGGFIARAEPLPLDKDGKEKERSRSRDSHSKSHSKSSSPSRTPNEDKHRRKRSRTPIKRKKRNYSRSSSGSPHARKHKKKYDRSPDRKDRYNNGDRKRNDYDYDRYDDRDYEYSSKSYKKDYKDSRDYKEQRGDYKDYKEKDYKEYKDYNRSKDKDRYYNGGNKDKYRSDSRTKHRDRSRSPRDRRR